MSTPLSPLFTDLYELTMAASYYREEMNGLATFSLFARRLPRTRGFLVAVGLEDALEYLHAMRFSPQDLEYLQRLHRFDPDFLRMLSQLRFTGQVRAVAEGTVLFADEPLLEVTAPMIEAQIVETAMLNFCHHQTVVASKAARCVLAARGRSVVEFGLRRTPGIDGGMKAARSSFIAGAGSTSNVLAGATYEIPTTGTMAHSYVTAFPSEMEAFRAYAAAFPDQTVLLLDTYGTLAAAHKAVQVANELAAHGGRLAAVRLDSGDLVTLSQGVREILDQAGHPDVKIFASGGLDEDEIDRCLEAGAKVDAFGVGTKMTVSDDAPSLDLVYKLVRYQGRDVLKLSEGKRTWPGAKQVYRRHGGDGKFTGDLIAGAEEPAPRDGAPLLETVMDGGHIARPHPSLPQIQAHCAAQIARLPDAVKRLREPGAYPVRYSDRLVAKQKELEGEARTREGV
ncbi:MAG TPA: nicotinate phosphoribosyltransferase [Gemmatimonadales bacterium]|nr:nicotinate phosphoribosyltransferase [Gemmatimonadales bacterium]